MKPLPMFLALLLCGCAGGPTHKYYNPVMPRAKFKGPVTISRVDNVREEVTRLRGDGYCVVGTTDYGGKHPEAIELKTQAWRANANHVVYSSEFVPAPPGSWSFGFNRFGGGGGSHGGSHNVHIVFLGK